MHSVVPSGPRTAARRRWPQPGHRVAVSRSRQGPQTRPPPGNETGSARTRRHSVQCGARTPVEPAASSSAISRCIAPDPSGRPEVSTSGCLVRSRASHPRACGVGATRASASRAACSGRAGSASATAAKISAVRVLSLACATPGTRDPRSRRKYASQPRVHSASSRRSHARQILVPSVRVRLSRRVDPQAGQQPTLAWRVRSRLWQARQTWTPSGLRQPTRRASPQPGQCCASNRSWQAVQARPPPSSPNGRSVTRRHRVQCGARTAAELVAASAATSRCVAVQPPGWPDVSSPD